MRKQCAACGKEFESKRKNAKYCPGSSRCRVRAHRAPKADEPESPVNAAPDPPAGDVAPFEGALTRVTRAQLERARRLDTPLGVNALILAARLDNPLSLADTGSSFAAISKEYRAALAEAMRDAETERDELDDIMGSASLKLISGGAG